MPQ
ncbi:hypothetical protein YPPY66_4914, partial [Yersinia pestis PY-66]|jgi:hypothetical protein